MAILLSYQQKVSFSPLLESLFLHCHRTPGDSGDSGDSWGWSGTMIGQTRPKPGDWCILLTSGARTIPLVRSLGAAGFRVWAPVRIIKRPAPGQRRALHLGLRRRMIEAEVPILSGFVFAAGEQLDDLVRVAAAPDSKHPPFSIFQKDGIVPFVGEAGLAGLRLAEADAAAWAQAERDAETREEMRKVRAEQLRSQQARLKALRSVSKTFTVGQRVDVAGAPALDGLPAIVQSSDGTTTTIAFGTGLLTMKVESWRVFPFALSDGDCLSSGRG